MASWLISEQAETEAVTSLFITYIWRHAIALVYDVTPNFTTKVRWNLVTLYAIKVKVNDC